MNLKILTSLWPLVLLWTTSCTFNTLIESNFSQGSYLSLETAPGGGGQIISQVDLYITSEDLQLYSVLRNIHDNTFESSAAVTWSMEGAFADLLVLNGGTEAKLTNYGVGSGRVTITKGEFQKVIEVNVTFPPTPQGEDDSFYVAENETGVSLSVLANDNDAGGYLPLVIDAASSPPNGSVLIVSGSSLSYTPNASFVGKDRFTYTLKNSLGGTDVIDVEVNVMAPYSWTGLGADNNWSTNLNWCGAVIGGACTGNSTPSATSDVIFNDTCTNCNSTIDVNGLTIASLSLNTGYSGTLNLPGANNLTISGQFLQYDGFYVGSSGNLTVVNGDPRIGLYGGSFTSQSGNLYLNFVGTTPFVAIDMGASATFSHNSGYIRVRKLGSGSCQGNPAVFNLKTGTELYNFRSYSQETYGGCSVSFTNSVIFKNELDFANMLLSGDVNLEGTLKISGSAGASGAIPLNGVINFTTAGDQYYENPSNVTGRTAILRINKPSGRLIPQIGTNNFGIVGLIIDQGEFVAPPGVLDVYFSPSYAGCTGIANLFEVPAGTTFDHNSGTVRFNGAGQSGSCDGRARINLGGGSFYNLTNTNFGGLYGEAIFYAGAAGVMVSNDFTHNYSRFDGLWEVQGNVNLGSNTASGGATLKFSGGGSQTYTQSVGASTSAFGQIEVDKQANGVTQTSNVDFLSAGQNLILANGFWDTAGFNLTIDNSLGLSTGTSVELSSGTNNLIVNSVALPAGPHDNGNINP